MRTLDAELKNSMAGHGSSMLVFQQRENARMEQDAKRGKGKAMQLTDKKKLPKECEGEKDKDGFRNFSKKVSAYCNASQDGFRGVLGWAAIQKDQIPRSKFMESNWPYMLEADAQLYDLLIQITTDGALLIVENCEGHGFAAW